MAWKSDENSRKCAKCGRLFSALYAQQSGQLKCVCPKDDPVDHPKHYTSHPSGVECITVTEHFNFNVGNAIKYLWRSDHKNVLEDLKKARWYIQREIERLEKAK